jgi:hypothetical protein
MQDIPQPADDPYSPGDRVKIYIGPEDPDSQYHGLVCEILEVLKDDLDTETGRDLDAYSYRVRNDESNTELPISFRHRDLVPVADIQ